MGVSAARAVAPIPILIPIIIFIHILIHIFIHITPAEPRHPLEAVRSVGAGDGRRCTRGFDPRLRKNMNKKKNKKKKIRYEHDCTMVMIGQVLYAISDQTLLLIHNNSFPTLPSLFDCIFI